MFPCSRSDVFITLFSHLPVSTRQTSILFPLDSRNSEELFQAFLCNSPASSISSPGIRVRIGTYQYENALLLRSSFSPNSRSPAWGLLLVLCLSPSVLNLKAKNWTICYLCSVVSSLPWGNEGRVVQVLSEGRVGVTENTKKNILYAQVLVILP